MGAGARPEWDLWGLGRSRCDDHWLHGLDGSAEELWRSLESLAEAFRPNSDDPQRILLIPKSPGVLIRGLIWANYWAQRSPLWLFLGNPDWAIAEQKILLDHICPHQVWGDRHNPWDGTVLPQSPGRPNGGDFLDPSRSYVGISTGGSSGTLRFAMHSWESLWSAVTGFREYFDPESDHGRIHSFCTLPLFHVSGLMQFLRSAWSGGQFQLGCYPKAPAPIYPALAWSRPDALASPGVPQGFISLVPTQLARLLDQPQAIAWLRQFRVILVGGAPAWPDLLARSRQARLPLAPTYGMTETAAQVATLKPDAFLKGQAGVGRPLPHVTLHLTPQTAEPIRLSTSALAVGYWPGSAIAPDLPSHPPFQWMTGDLGRLDEAGYLSILGRRDDTILSGGENVMPQEVEAAILATGWAADVCVVGLPDPEWGQRVAALWVPRTDDEVPSLEQWQGLLGDRLSRYKHPKIWRVVPRIPRNNRGKLNRAAIAQWFQAGQ